ncbi:MAG: hypothetical protein ABI794_06280 [Betaproteobacteria bacterium]
MSEQTDREIEALLAQTRSARARLRSEAAHELPPKHLDDTILAASRRAVSARPVPARKAGVRRWQVPLAAAAVIVLATSVSLLMVREGEHERVLAPLPVPADVSPPATGQAAAPDTARSGEAVNALRDEMRKETPRAQPLEDREKKSVGQVVAPFPPASEAPRSARRNDAETGTTAHDQAPAPAAAEAERAAAQPADEGSTVDSRIGTEPAPGSAAAVPPPPTSSASGTAGRLSGAGNFNQHKPLPREGAKAELEQDPASRLDLIRKRWEAGDRIGAAAALAEFLEAHPDYELPPGYPVPRPLPAPAKESGPVNR